MKKVTVLSLIVIFTLLLTISSFALTKEEQAWKEDILTLLSLVKIAGDYSEVAAILEVVPTLKKDPEIRQAFIAAAPQGINPPVWVGEERKVPLAIIETPRKIATVETTEKVSPEGKLLASNGAGRWETGKGRMGEPEKRGNGVREKEKRRHLEREAKERHQEEARLKKEEQGQVRGERLAQLRAEKEERRQLKQAAKQSRQEEVRLKKAERMAQSAKLKAQKEAARKAKLEQDRAKKEEKGQAREERLVQRKAEKEERRQLKQAAKESRQEKVRLKKIEQASSETIMITVELVPREKLDKIETVAIVKREQEGPLPPTPTKIEEEEIADYYRIGKKYYGKDDYPQAIREFEKALEVDPLHQKAGKYLVRSHYKMGEKFYKNQACRQASIEFRKVLALEPGHQKAQEYLNTCQTRVRIEVVGEISEEVIPEVKPIAPVPPEKIAIAETTEKVGRWESEPVGREEQRTREMEKWGREEEKIARGTGVKPTLLPQGAEIIHSTDIVTGVKAGIVAGKMMVTITLSGKRKYTVSERVRPPRIIIDIPHTINAVSPARIMVNQGGMRMIEVTQHRVVPFDETRVIIRLSRFKEYEVKSKGDEIYVEFEE